MAGSPGGGELSNRLAALTLPAGSNGAAGAGAAGAERQRFAAGENSPAQSPPPPGQEGIFSLGQQRPAPAALGAGGFATAEGGLEVVPAPIHQPQGYEYVHGKGGRVVPGGAAHSPASERNR